MGILKIDCEVVHVAKPSKRITVPKLLVDSGSEFTWIPETDLKKVGVTVAKKDQPFQMANGQTITRSIGYAILRAGGFETVDEVVFGQPGDLALLGSRTLRRLWRCCGSAKEKTGDRW